MTILAIEFSSQRRSVAIARDARLLDEAFTDTGRSTSAPQLIAEVLQKAGLAPRDIDRLAVGIGPGSYTGIRRAIATIQGWHLAGGTDVVAVGSFDLLARIAAEADSAPAWLVTDAQRGEWATVRCLNGGVQGPVTLRPRSDVDAWLAAGERVISPDTGLVGGEILFPTAAGAALMAEHGIPVPPESLAAVYLREAVFTKAPALRALPGIEPAH
jgi:tRNA threonylcarbamoyl adenosine modification protein YeaZ